MTLAGRRSLAGREVVDLLASHDLELSRARGQHLVVDPNTVRRIARLAGVGPGDRVVEVGAGLGALTLALLETGASVTAVEIDRRMVPVLRAVVGGGGARVVEGDALDLDWGALLGPAPWVLVANLPYGVAATLVVRLLEEVPAIERFLVMVQREVGERLAADAGQPAYGALSVKVAYRATARIVGRVPASVFLPPPTVESALVDIRRLPRPAVAPEVVGPVPLFRLVRAGFSQRRKMLRRSLAGLVDPDAFACAGVDPQARPEGLDVAAWGRLAACQASLLQPSPSPSGRLPS